jgi:hypothetical protein
MSVFEPIFVLTFVPYVVFDVVVNAFAVFFAVFELTLVHANVALL